MTCTERVERAAANLPQSASSALFTVSGGRVLLVGIVGEVTTAVQNQANQAKLVFNPAVGSNVDLCQPGDIANAAVGTTFTLDPEGVTSTSIKQSVSFAKPVLVYPFLLSPGDVELNCAASNTGQASWTLLYTPLDPGAKVEAV